MEKKWKHFVTQQEISVLKSLVALLCNHRKEKNVTLPQGLMVMLEQHQLLTEMSAVIPQGSHHEWHHSGTYKMTNVGNKCKSNLGLVWCPNVKDQWPLLSEAICGILKPKWKERALSQEKMEAWEAGEGRPHLAIWFISILARLHGPSPV